MGLFKNKLVLCLVLMITIFAISSPFWLFHSEESVASSETEALNEGSSQSGELDIVSLSAESEGSKIAQEPSDEKQAHNKQTEDNLTEHIDGTLKQDPHLDQPIVRDLLSGSASKEQEDRKAQPQDKQDLASSASNKSTSKAQATVNPEENKGNSGAKDSLEGKQAAIAQSAKAEKEDKQNQESQLAKNNHSKEQAPSSKANQQTTGTKEQAKAHQNKDSNPKTVSSNSLQAQVDSLVSQKTSEDKDKYQQALQDRYEQVTWAVETIKANSRIYLPESLSTRAVIVFFGVDVKPVQKHMQVVDTLTGASTLALEPEVIYTEHGKEYKSRFMQGSGVKYIAKMLQEETGGKLYDVIPVYSYPKDPVLLYETAFKQQISQLRPELTDDQSIDFAEYDTIYLCYGIWWEDLPMPIYSFLDKYDLSGKVIIPLCLSRKDGFQKTLEHLRAAEPNATIRNAWRIRPQELEKLEFREKLRDWLVNLEKQVSEGTYN